MKFSLRNTWLLALAALLVAACRTSPRWEEFATNEDLYRAARAALEEGNTAFAARGFERLTLALGSRDTLTPRAHFYHGVAQFRLKQYLQAAEAFTRVSSLYPNDTLADDALFSAARSYAALWGNPELDDTYGKTARQTLERLLIGYPQTSLREETFRELNLLDEKFAAKDFETGMYYYRLGAFPSANTYFRYVLELYPSTDVARKARIQMVRSFNELAWSDEAATQCGTLREMYPRDAEVIEVCGARQRVDTTRT